MKAVMKYPGSKWSLSDWIISLLQAAERLRGVQIDNRSVLELIPRFNYEI